MVLLEGLASQGQGEGGGTHRHWEYIVVGAGPAGLQMGHFLKTAGRDYMLLERNNISGTSQSVIYPEYTLLCSGLICSSLPIIARINFENNFSVS